MSKAKNAFERQDAIIGKFKRDARSKDTNSATQQALREGARTRKIRAEYAKELSEAPMFVPGSLAHLEYIKEQRALQA